ncbi:MAG TPA: methylated-DNA--[protein]-cysteine S-methyltransferase [Methylomirabilota bacterium]
MTAIGFTLFDTAIGRCGLAWSPGGIAGVQLPEGSDPAMRARLRRRFPGAREAPPPAEARRAIDQIVALLRGEPCELESIALDMESVAPFERSVYEAARTIPPGATLSYGEIARRLGAPFAARDVGHALGRNPFPIVVPCHRVVAAGGKLGGFSARGGAATKRRLLSVERARGHGALPLFALSPPVADDRSPR